MKGITKEFKRFDLQEKVPRKSLHNEPQRQLTQLNNFTRKLTQTKANHFAWDHSATSQILSHCSFQHLDWGRF